MPGEMRLRVTLTQTAAERLSCPFSSQSRTTTTIAARHWLDSSPLRHPYFASFGPAAQSKMPTSADLEALEPIASECSAVSDPGATVGLGPRTV